jgi:hypothetical protein
LIRHVGAAALPPDSLPVTMIQASFGAFLVALVGRSALTAAPFVPTTITAILLPSIAAPADPEQSAAFHPAAETLS